MPQPRPEQASVAIRSSITELNDRLPGVSLTTILGRIAVIGEFTELSHRASPTRDPTAARHLDRRRLAFLVECSLSMGNL